MFLVAIGTALMFAVPVDTGGPNPLCPGGHEEWYRAWFNNTSPIGNDDYEPIPYDAQYICPPHQGSLRVRCTSEDARRHPDSSFTGMFYDNINKFVVECSVKNGSVCRVSGKGGLCPDFAIQVGCVCTKSQVTTKPAVSTTPGTAPPANCGPATTPKTPTNCSCPAKNSPLHNSAFPCYSNMEFFALAVCLVTILLQH